MTDRATDEPIETIEIGEKALDVGHDSPASRATASVQDLSAQTSDSGWTLYEHRHDGSVRYLARLLDDKRHEVKRPGAPDSEAFVLDAGAFEAIYEVSEEIHDEEEDA